MKLYKIEAWNQPEGIGYGWAPCHENKKDATFFVFERSGDRLSCEFKTRKEAEEYVMSLKT